MVIIKRYIIYTISFILLFLTAIGSSLIAGNEKYMLSAIIAAIISIIPFFIRFEQKRVNSRETATIAAMVALCIASRFVFAFIPHFKPVTALIIIIGMYFGSDCGFITGSLTALLSNFQYGQGPWTVFQMAAWGLIGFAAGYLTRFRFFRNRIVNIFFSAASGIVYSLVMDIYTTISTDSIFTFERYFTYIMFSIPVMLEYIISNIIFMLILQKSLGKKLARIKTKYGIFQ